MRNHVVRGTVALVFSLLVVTAARAQLPEGVTQQMIDQVNKHRVDTGNTEHTECNN